MWRAIGEFFGGLFTTLMTRYYERRGLREPHKTIKCVRCGYPMPSTYQNTPPVPGYTWDFEACLGCGMPADRGYITGGK